VLAFLASLASVAIGDPVPFDCKSAHIDGHHPQITCGQKPFFGQFRGPNINGRPTIEMRYATTLGTGVFAQDSALLQERAGTYHVLWSHERLEAWSGWPFPDGAVVYRWKYDGRIIVTGTRTVGRTISVSEAKAVGRSSPLPPETYCFSEDAQRFRRC
jgi:hypothetical protein